MWSGSSRSPLRPPSRGRSRLAPWSGPATSRARRRDSGASRPRRPSPGCSAGHHDGRVRLLQRQRPRVDLAIVEVLALPAEGARLVHAATIRSCASSKRSRLYAGLTLLTSARHRRRGRSLRSDARARSVDHRQLFGQPQRIIDDRQRIAQHENFAAPGDLGQHGAGDVDRRLHAERGRVMLVDHNAIEAGVIRHLILVVVAVVEIAGDFGIVVGVGQGQAQGRILLLEGRVVARIWLLGEIVVFGLALPSGGGCAVRSSLGDELPHDLGQRLRLLEMWPMAAVLDDPQRRPWNAC